METKLENHPLSAIRGCLFSIFTATLHIWRPSPPSVTRGREILWWHGYIWLLNIYLYIYFYLALTV